MERELGDVFLTRRIKNSNDIVLTENKIGEHQSFFINKNREIVKHFYNGCYIKKIAENGEKQYYRYMGDGEAIKVEKDAQMDAIYKNKKLEVIKKENALMQKIENTEKGG
jgi:hypothetical protein